MQKFNFSYDKENDDLLLYNPEAKSKGSVEIGDLILDYNSKKELVGLQMIHASTIIKDMLSKEDAASVRDVLNNLEECNIEIKQKNNLLIIKIYLNSKVKEIAPVISVPSIQESSPALACA